MAKASGFAMVKRLEKKSFIVIEAPAGSTFADTAKVKEVKGTGDSGATSEYKEPKVTPHPATNPKRLLLSFNGKKIPVRSPEDPEPGELTITLEDQGTGIEPSVVVDVVFVDEYDE